MSHNVLQLYDQVVHHLFGHNREELDNNWMRCKLRVLAAFLVDRFAKCVVHGLQDSCAGLLPTVTRNLLIHDQNNQASNAHQLLVRVIVAIVELRDDDFYRRLNHLPEGLFIAARLPQTLEEELIHYK